jgi:cell pole-organizing protein PopZ
MEEILASIRRIIAEGERDAREGPRSGSGASAPQERATETGAEAAVAPDTDVLILTEMVREDGSIVSLQAPGPADADRGSDAETAGAETVAEHPPVPPWLAPESTGTSDVSDVAGAAPHDEPPQASGPSAEPVAAPIPAAAEPADTGVDPDRSPSQSPAESPPPTEPSTAEERISVPAEGYRKPDVVSEETLAASTAALAQLAQSVSRTRDTPPGQSKTVEDLVREAVEPMLKQWLDANLSKIVERMVREAIDRVVRRVE